VGVGVGNKVGEVVKVGDGLGVGAGVWVSVRIIVCVMKVGGVTKLEEVFNCFVCCACMIGVRVQVTLGNILVGGLARAGNENRTNIRNMIAILENRLSDAFCFIRILLFYNIVLKIANIFKTF